MLRSNSSSCLRVSRIFRHSSFFSFYNFFFPPCSIGERSDCKVHIGAGTAKLFGMNKFWAFSLATHYSLRKSHYSLRKSHYSLRKSHHSLPTTHSTLPTTHYSRHSAYYSLLTVLCLLLTSHGTLPTSHFSRHSAYYSLLSSYYSTLYLLLTTLSKESGMWYSNLILCEI